MAKKKKKKESFENRVENVTTTMCVRVCVWGERVEVSKE